MSGVILTKVAAPSAPSSTKGILYLDNADGRLKVAMGDSTTDVLAAGRGRNYLANGGFWFAQRQTPGTLTTYSNTTGRTYGLDRWGITNENASAQVARTDATTPETGLSARYYARVVKITSTGKVILSQALEANESVPLRGRRVRLQFKAKNVTGSHVLRLGLLQLAAAGTVNTIPGTFVAAFGAAGTDPTWGTNLAAITPLVAEGTIAGAGVSCTLTSSWQRFSGVFLVPSDCKNLVAAIFTNGQPVANDEFDVAEVGLYDGDEERDWSPASIHEELSRCQRHCWKTFNIDTGPVQNAGLNTGEHRFAAQRDGAVVQRGGSLPLPVVMFAAPTVTKYNPQVANAEARDQNANVDCTSTTINNITERSLNIIATGNAATQISNTIGIHLLAEAEL